MKISSTDSTSEYNLQSTILTNVLDTGITSDFTMLSKDFNKRVKTSEPGLSLLLPIQRKRGEA